MSAIWMRARSELRARVAPVIALALIVGVIGGVVIAAAAGARRTDSAYGRFVQAQNALDVAVDVNVKGDVPAAEELLHKVLQLPQVRASSRVTLIPGQLDIPGRKKPGEVFPLLSPDGRFGTTINRIKILEGRMYDPDAPNEVVPSFSVADELGLEVGDKVRLVPGGLFGEEPRRGENAPVPVTLHVVGIGAAPGFFQPLAGGYLPAVMLSPAFFQAHHDFVDERDVGAAVVLRRGLADITAFKNAIKHLVADLPPEPEAHVEFPFNQAQQTVGVQQATRAQAIALWVLAALVAVAAIAVFAQALARQTFLESIEYPTLRSLGMSPRQLVAVGLIRVGVVGIVGGAIAAIVGFLLSPFTPTGLARIAEPDPGLALDTVVVLTGAVGIILVVGLLSAVPAWRAARAEGTSLGTTEVRASRRPSAVARLFARASFPPSATAGVRMALEPGRGRTAVPVRSTMFGASVSLVALAAALAFGASLDHLVTTPKLSGWNWDVIAIPRVEGDEAFREAQKKYHGILERSSEVEGYAVGSFIQVRIGSSRAFGLVAEPRKGSVSPSIVEGRLPRSVDEIVLGTDTMRGQGIGIGDTVAVHGKAATLEMRVVGRVAVPSLFFTLLSRPGEGAALTIEGADRLTGQQENNWATFVRLAPGVSQDGFLQDIRERVGRLFVLRRSQSSQIHSLGGIGDVPLVLAGIIALMAIATMAHTLVTSIRRRRLDLAILKTLGFMRRQVSATVAWQATTLASVAILVGLPLGVMGGRWGWNVFADRLGVVPEPVVPALAILLIAPAAVLLANLIAVIPGRIASRLRPAPVLRTE